MTLSETGEADTPAGGSVCMRFKILVMFHHEEVQLRRAHLEVPHQATASGGRHGDAKTPKAQAYRLRRCRYELARIVS